METKASQILAPPKSTWPGFPFTALKNGVGRNERVLDERRPHFKKNPANFTRADF
jgi:hypothetical protein